MRIAVTFMTILETPMQWGVMGFAMAGAAFMDYLMLPFMTVYTLQFAVLARISLLTDILLLVTTAAEPGRYIFSQFGRGRSMMLMTFEAVTILHITGMTVMAVQAVQTFSMGWMALVAFQLCM